MKKRIMLSVTAVVISAVISLGHAQTTTGYGDTVLITADRSCTKPENPAVLTAEVIMSGIDTTGISYTWMYSLHGENIWYEIPDSVRSQYVVSYSPLVRHYAVRIRVLAGSFPSNQIIICPCGVTDIKTLDILSGGISPMSGKVLLQYMPKNYVQTVLEESTDGWSFSAIANITGTSMYRSIQRISSIHYYRIKGVTEFGTVEYGKVFKVPPRLSAKINYTKPFTVAVSTIDEKEVAVFSDIISSDATNPYWSIKQKCDVPSGIYILRCRQGDIYETVRVLF